MLHMGKGNMDEDGQEQEFSFQIVDKNFESAEDSCLEPQRLLVVNSGTVKSIDQRWFLNNLCSLDNRLPKNIISFDQKYFLSYLDLVQGRASRGASCGLSSDTGVLSDINMSEEWILGSITGSESMTNILNSPLLNKLGVLDCDVVNSGKIRSLADSDFLSSPSGFSTSSSHSSLKLQSNTNVGFPGFVSKPVHKKRHSMSTTISTCSEQSFSAPAVVSQGMIQIKWKNGLPNFVLSVDGKKEVFVADVVKVNSVCDKCLDYVYTFRLRPESKIEHDMYKRQQDYVGKMTVSTSFTLSPNESEIMETVFVLYGSGADSTDDTQSSTNVHRKNRRLSKKVGDMLRQRKPSKFDGTNVILEDSSWSPSLDIDHLITNFELAAIVVKSQLHNTRKKPEIGGWGLKFLKKSSLETSVRPETPRRGSNECSISADVIVPAGLHGGPRTQNSGPSSLLDRWTSGGHCECGGWDTGCPLTILNTRRNGREDVTPTDDVSGDCKTIDLIIQGSKQNAPIMKIANIHDGLFYIHFEPNLSALQSFAIAAALIHSHDPDFRSKLYRR